MSLLLLVLAACGGGEAPREASATSARSQPSMERSTMRNQPGGTSARQETQPRGTIVKVALLLPLSGEASDLGRAMLDASLLALQDKQDALGEAGQRNTRIILLPKDTQGTVGEATAAAQATLNEGANLVLGPVFAKSLKAVSPILQQRNISVISFSNDRTAGGNGVYLMGFMPEEQIRLVATYAVKQGARRLVALLPGNAYGETVAAELLRTANGNGAEIVRTIYYAPAAQDISKELDQAYAIPDAEHAGSAYVPDFDAILIPEGGQRLAQLSAWLEQHSLNAAAPRILGSGQWDDATTLGHAVLSGSWFASADPQKRQRFEQHFQAVYGYHPLRLASLAYDATSLAATLAFMRGPNAFSSAQLTAASGYDGPADGLFRLRNNGSIERGLAILEVTSQGFAIREQAPSVFP